MLFPFRRRRAQPPMTRVPLADDIYVYVRVDPDHDGKVERIARPGEQLGIGDLRELIARRDM